MCFFPNVVRFSRLSLKFFLIFKLVLDFFLLFFLTAALSGPLGVEDVDGDSGSQ